MQGNGQRMKEYWRFVARFLSILWGVVFVLSGVGQVEGSPFANNKGHYGWSFPTNSQGYIDATVPAWLFLTLAVWLVVELIARAVARRAAVKPTVGEKPAGAGTET